jgi:uncharacterized protein (DUF697 family)
MAKLGGAKGFWDIIRSISVADIARQANRPISVAIVGDAEKRAEAAQALYAVERMGQLIEPDKARALPESPFVQGFDSTATEGGFPDQPGVFDFVIDVGEGRHETPSGTTVYALSELGGWDATLDRILEDRPELALPLARNFPVFRRRVAQRIITETATANAQFALITGVTEAIPITAILLPVNSLSDIVILTKNQAMMVLRLAAAYGLSVDYKSRMKEVAPILGNAFGWRAIARELVGAVPFVGFVVRAMISFAGTVTVGKAAQYYYETGENLTSAQARHLYRDAYQSSRDKVRSLADSLRNSRGGGGGGSKRLPAPVANGVEAVLVAEPAPLGLDSESESELPGPHDPMKQVSD